MGRELKHTVMRGTARVGGGAAHSVSVGVSVAWRLSIKVLTSDHNFFPLPAPVPGLCLRPLHHPLRFTSSASFILSPLPTHFFFWSLVLFAVLQTGFYRQGKLFVFFGSSPEAPAFPILRLIIRSQHGRPCPFISFNTTPSLISDISSSSFSLLQILDRQTAVIFCKVQFGPPKSVVLYTFALPRPATCYPTCRTRLICCTNLSKGPLPCLAATHQLRCYLGHPSQPSLRVQNGRRSLQSLTVKTWSESLHGIKQ